jgi:F-type H+-transporting ATPase subunit c
MKWLKHATLAVALVAVVQGAALAQTVPVSVDDQARTAYAAAPKYAFSELRAFGVGMVIIGAALGIGGLTRSAVESMARQPEMAGDIRTAMIISAALIEGVTFFALIIIMLFLSPY